MANELGITSYEVTKNGKKIENTEKVGTGYKLKDTKNNKEYTLVVLGDVNGDGKVTPADSTIALRTYVGLSKLTDAEKLAGDVNGDGKITPADSTILLRTYVGLTNINL